MPVSTKLLDMLNRLPKRSEKIFANFNTLRNNYHHARKNLILKLQNPRLNIHMHSFRHWKATMEYHKNKDILHVQQLLGHRNINYTLIYINIKSTLFQNTGEDYPSKVVYTVEEACTLVDAGFEYVTDMDGAKIFRKRK